MCIGVQCSSNIKLSCSILVSHCVLRVAHHSPDTPKAAGYIQGAPDTQTDITISYNNREKGPNLASICQDVALMGQKHEVNKALGSARHPSLDRKVPHLCSFGQAARTQGQLIGLTMHLCSSK